MLEKILQYASWIAVCGAAAAASFGPSCLAAAPCSVLAEPNTAHSSRLFWWLLSCPMLLTFNNCFLGHSDLMVGGGSFASWIFCLLYQISSFYISFWLTCVGLADVRVRPFLSKALVGLPGDVNDPLVPCWNFLALQSTLLSHDGLLSRGRGCLSPIGAPWLLYLF